jgi:competence transcription factor ComK
MVDDMLSQLPYYHHQYVKCYTDFMRDKEPTVFSITEKELQMSNISLKNQIERLILENTTLQSQVDKYKRLEQILEYIENRTPIGKESFVLRKINLMFNGLSDYGQELKW